MATKYPIILAHGLFMKPRFFRAFKYLQKRLSEAGYKVYVADTDGVGGIENNVLQLKARILEILKKESAEKINIIAHSKGDCIDGSISHNEIICYMTRRKKKRIVADFYIKLCNELTEKGL
jgi:nucleoside-triphosphatase THEP1